MNRHLQYEQSYINTQNSSQNSQLNSQAIYYMLLKDSTNLLSISKFKVSKASKPLYPDTLKHPDFFNYNLVSPGRVIKVLEGPKAVLRGFYYQLMKLAFEIQIQNKDYIEILKNVVFNPQLMVWQDAQSPSSGKSYSDAQYKKIIAEFIYLLLNQNIPNFQLTIIQYPIVDEALIKIMQNLLKLKYGSGYKLTNKQILEILSQIFQVNVVQYGSCFKFEESDIFLYEKSQNELYIAFLNQMAEMSESSSTKQLSSSNKILSNNKISQESGDNSEYDFSENSKNIYQQHKIYNDKNQSSHSQLMQTPGRNQNRQHSSHLATQFQISQQKKGYRNTYGGRGSNRNSEQEQEQYKQSSLKKQVNKYQRPLYQLTAMEKEQKISRDDFDSYSSYSSSLINNLNSLMNTKSSGLQNQKVSQNPKQKFNQISNLQAQKSNKYVYKSPFSNFQNPNKFQNSKIKNIDEHITMQDKSKINYFGVQDKQIKQKSKDIKNNGQQQFYNPIYNNTSNQAKYNNYSFNTYDYLKNKKGSEGTVVQSPSSFNSNIGSISQDKNSLINYKSNPNINVNVENVPMINSITTNPYIASSVKTNQIYSYQIESLKSNAFIKSSANQSFSNNLIRQSKKQQQTKKVYQQQSRKSNSIEKEQNLFHKPQKKTRFNLNLNQVQTSSKQVIAQDSIGTLYRQFTDTKVLKILPQVMQDNIRRMRKKFRGKHTKTFTGFY